MKPRLLVTCDSDRGAIHLYEAEIPALFLRKFAQPDCEGAVRVDIQHRKIPFAPYSSFKDRIRGVLISRPVKDCGATDFEDQFQTSKGSCHEIPVLPKSNQDGRKRKRGTETDETCYTTKRKE